MAKIVNTNQQVRVAGMMPMPVYSRVMVHDLTTRVPVPVYDYIISKPVGTRVWLLGVEVCIQPHVIDGLVNLWFQIKTGQVSDASLADVVFRWDSVIDVERQANNQVYHYGGPCYRSYKMSRLYTGQGRRFASVVQMFGVSVDCNVSIAYQISEG